MNKSNILGMNGMCATSQNIASDVGIDILKKGGNAVDAAIAIASTLSVIEPNSCGLGGDCFMLYYEASKNKVYAMNGSGKSPNNLTLEKVYEKFPNLNLNLNNNNNNNININELKLPPFDAYTITVPGAVAGFCDAIEKFGNFNINEILLPSINIAENGFPVGEKTSYYWKKGLKQLNLSNNKNELLLNGQPPEPGDIFRNYYIANVLKEISEYGKNIYYNNSRISNSIINEIQLNNGLMTLNDLENHETLFIEPISFEYNNIKLYEVPPNSQGLTSLIALNILNESNHLNFNSTTNYNKPFTINEEINRYHSLIEVLKLSFADARQYITDPNYIYHKKFNIINNNINDINNEIYLPFLNKEYGKIRSSLINPLNATNNIQYGCPENSSCTVSFQTVDKDGNAVSFVCSNYMGFGTGLIPYQCGFTLQNRGHNFSLDENNYNVLGPNKRPYHTIIPAIATIKKEINNEEIEDLYMTFSNMGGFMQPQGHVQLLTNILQLGLTPQEAIDYPRFCIIDGETSGPIAIEEGVNEEVINGLRNMGHEIELMTGYDRTIFGRAQIILKDPNNGVYWGGSDMRADGCAIGY